MLLIEGGNAGPVSIILSSPCSDSTTPHLYRSGDVCCCCDIYYVIEYLESTIAGSLVLLLRDVCLGHVVAGRAQQQYIQQRSLTQQACQEVAALGVTNNAAPGRTKLVSFGSMGQEKPFLLLGLCTILAIAIITGEATDLCT